MDEWMRESQDMQYYSQEYSQEYSHHQDMAWSGNTPVHMPQHHAPAPQPPRQPYPGVQTPPLPTLPDDPDQSSLSDVSLPELVSTCRGDPLLLLCGLLCLHCLCTLACGER